MNILLWTTAFPPAIGGLEHMVHDLAVRYSQLGHRVTVVDSGSDASGASRLHGDDWEISLHRVLCTRIERMEDISDQVAFRRLDELIADLRPDIVNVHFLGDQTPFALRLWEKHQFRLVTTAHGSDLNRLHAYREARQAAVCAIAKRADAFVACSKALVSVARNLGIVARRTVVIPNGAKSVFFGSGRCELDSSAKSHLFACGRLHSIKGFDILVRAYALLPKHDAPPLLIAGDGPERIALRELAQALGVETGIALLGNRHPSDIARLMQASRCFIAPSRNEGLPLVVLEAMASGRPVIASAVGGIPEVIESGINGLLVPPEDPEALALAICYYLQNPAVAEAAGRHGRALADAYSLNTAASDYLKLYADL